MMFKLYISFLVLALPFSICTAQTTGKPLLKSVNIEFTNVVDSQLMRLGNSYKNSFGEEYILKTFKYYISNISLHTTDNKIIPFKGSHLVNEADIVSKTITLQVPKGTFKQMSFFIGVDSIYNVSGTQTGDLDPLKGMFWTWNSGYIIAKLEASSNASTAANNNVVYHIGGFKGSQNTTRNVVLTFPDPLAVNGPTKVTIEANANRWFDAEHPLKIATAAVCTTPGKLATQFADNYGKMFKLSAVK